MTVCSPKSKVYIAGHQGLVGSAIYRELHDRRGYRNLVTRSRDALDLLDSVAVDRFFAMERPNVVFLAAAKVGGIYANNTYRSDFIFENLSIQNNVIGAAHRYDCERLIFLGSSCIYPRNAPQPMSELALLTGPLEETNRPYAIAKIAGLELINGLRHQHRRNYFSVMPTNLFGPNDNFHPDNSHVLPALVRRFFEATQSGAKEVVVWGSGTPMREFLYSEDCAEAIVHLAETLDFDDLASSFIGKNGWAHVNVGSGEEISIRGLATQIAQLCSFTGKITFDTTKPDGTPRKFLNTNFLRKSGWKPKFSFSARLAETVRWYRAQQFPSVEVSSTPLIGQAIATS